MASIFDNFSLDKIGKFLKGALIDGAGNTNKMGATLAFGLTGIGMVLGWMLGGVPGLAAGAAFLGGVGVVVGAMIGLGSGDGRTDYTPFSNTVKTHTITLGEGKEKTRVKLIEFNTKITNGISEETYEDFKNFDKLNDQIRKEANGTDRYDELLQRRDKVQASAAHLQGSIIEYNKVANEQNEKLIETNNTLVSAGLPVSQEAPTFRIKFADIIDNKDLMKKLVNKSGSENNIEFMKKYDTAEKRIAYANTVMDEYWNAVDPRTGEKRDPNTELDLKNTGARIAGGYLGRDFYTGAGGFNSDLFYIAKLDGLSVEQKTDKVLENMEFGRRAEISNYITHYMGYHGGEQDPRKDPIKLGILENLAERAKKIAETPGSYFEEDIDGAKKYGVAIDTLKNMRLKAEVDQAIDHNLKELAKVPGIIAESIQPHKEQVALVLQAVEQKAVQPAAEASTEPSNVASPPPPPSRSDETALKAALNANPTPAPEKSDVSFNDRISSGLPSEVMAKREPGGLHVPGLS